MSKLRVFKNYSITKFVIYNFFSKHIKRENDSYIFIDRKSKLIFSKKSQLIICNNLTVESSRIDSNIPSNIYFSKNSKWICNGGKISSSSISIWDDGLLETGEAFIVNSLTRTAVEKHIVFGNNVSIARSCYFNDSNSHDIVIDGKVIPRQKDIIVGNHVWFCAGTYVLKGCKINDNVIVGAKTLVLKNIDNNSIVVNKAQYSAKKFDKFFI